MNDTAAREAIVALERQFWTSDAAFHEAHVTDDCLMVFPGAGIMTREAALAGLRTTPRWREVVMDDVHVVTLTRDVVVLVYTAAARRDGMEAPYRASVSSTYVAREGAWRLAAHQQTPVA